MQRITYSLTLSFSALGLLLATSIGCGSANTATTPTSTTTPGASTIYAAQVNTSNSEILSFSTGSSGTAVTPSSMLTIAAGGPYFEALGVDTTGQIYVGTNLSSTPAIAVYAANSSGSAVATRTITLTNQVPTAFAFDASQNLYVGTGANNILVYSSTASGAAVPTRSISGSSTGINGTPTSLAVDSLGNIYVGLLLDILVFAPGASGNVPPARTITPANSLSFHYGGIALDSSNNLYASLTTSSGGGSIVEYSPTANGAVSPTRTIAGSATGINLTAGPLSLAIDTASNIYALTYNASAYYFLEFSPSASGNVAPTSSFASTTAFTSPGNSYQIGVH